MLGLSRLKISLMTSAGVGGSIYTLEQLNRLNAQTADGTLYSAYAASDAESNNYLVNNTVLAADGTSYNVI